MYQNMKLSIEKGSSLGGTKDIESIHYLMLPVYNGQYLAGLIGLTKCH